eukprot:CAMPEP_0115011238 /NCGR_PEP_ID=MMETSP0216-20121206/23851_1 /TAXON_ID=223996 /ORGANISM="Protocruzia adherens, Strain Boccale" /LENGTH=390 /DNA_ID=CAMNT_0002379723 /DNA_START=587 /DNA_END=1756 /DNA_ORIENTATION=+
MIKLQRDRILVVWKHQGCVDSRKWKLYGRYLDVATRKLGPQTDFNLPNPESTESENLLFDKSENLFVTWVNPSISSVLTGKRFDLSIFRKSNQDVPAKSSISSEMTHPLSNETLGFIRLKEHLPNLVQIAVAILNHSDPEIVEWNSPIKRVSPESKFALEIISDDKILVVCQISRTKKNGNGSQIHYDYSRSYFDIFTGKVLMKEPQYLMLEGETTSDKTSQLTTKDGRSKPSRILEKDPELTARTTLIGENNVRMRFSQSLINIETIKWSDFELQIEGDQSDPYLFSPEKLDYLDPRTLLLRIEYKQPLTGEETLRVTILNPTAIIPETPAKLKTTKFNIKLKKYDYITHTSFQVVDILGNVAEVAIIVCFVLAISVGMVTKMSLGPLW